MARKQKRGQPSNAGQFASDTSGRYAPTPSNLPSGYPSTQPNTGAGNYSAAYKRFTYQPAGIGEDINGYLARPSKFTQWRRKRGLTTRSSSSPKVKVSQFSHRGITYTIEQHPSPVLVATTSHTPNMVDPSLKEPGRYAAVVSKHGQPTMEGRWIACRGRLGSTEGGDADFVGRTRAEVEKAIRDQVDYELGN